MRILYFLFVFLLAACGQVKVTGQPLAQKPDSIVTEEIDTAFYGIRIGGSPKLYDLHKKQCEYERRILNTKCLLAREKENQVLDSARYVLTENLLNSIIPTWYGTPWAFEGCTAVPQKGEVACGYFVSTTLKHVGFNLDRYKLAQKKPETEALTLQDSIEILEGLSPEGLKNYFVRNKKDGLYFVGLSNHVGYLLQRKGELFFIHSNYIGSQGVTIEKAVFSQALASSGIYYLADITHNDALVKQWLEGKPLKIG